MAYHHGRVDGYSPEPYHFFKVILESTIRDGKLGIPHKFAKDYGSKLSSPVFFEVPNGEVWELELMKLDGKLWVQNGWRKFTEHYSLELGHFLVFRYQRNCRFQVLIFDRSASEIHYPYANNISTDMTKKPVLQCPRPPKIMRASNNGFSATKGNEKSKALERASSAFKSGNPFFLVFMQPTYVGLHSKVSCLSIPKEFSRKYLMDHGDVILCDSSGNTWSAQYRTTLGMNGQPYVKLLNGWDAFVRDNNLQVGDVCAFELIDCIDISFQVFIYSSKKADFHGSPAQMEAGITLTRSECLEPVKARETAFHREMKVREKALQRALAFTSENPFFVVVLRPSYVQSHALCISNDFTRKHFKTTLTNIGIALRLSNGKSWPVEYHQRSIGNPNARICNGWRAFVNDNKLKVGDVCVFELVSDTQISFKVIIFQAIADEDSHPSQGASEEALGLKSQSAKAPLIFRRVVLPLHLKEDCVDIPFRFVEQYFEPNVQKLILQVADRTWPVEITSNPRIRIAKLTSGWIKFARENSLREGDICVYELDTVNNNLLKVSISKYAS
ncbi:hypothetical protein Gotri_018818 [Gossypium trilobum]|uniref:TF-B3 domain-containing protein n=1 Tax=Gossypium trilobum TaxID=34281 RepID=A0A7J9EAV2_9ROSI|nr:hypothetical protein [Gossypium trilobum]